jgi:hypothetical protein
MDHLSHLGVDTRIAPQWTGIGGVERTFGEYSLQFIKSALGAIGVGFGLSKRTSRA